MTIPGRPPSDWWLAVTRTASLREVVRPVARTKRTLFSVLGWLVWKLLALVGLPAAKRRLEDRRGGSTPSRRRRR
ncbi:hypothetical protein SAMN04488570_1049 [Nocardioides scoriae]|uniref:Uncharacterized protein n=1 Tax=Nocardioides scoriae TaxID=642780 RepID=A0A1H1P5D0_9ACTN|nr:hypothetical protein SAMN04488570_1049 [Nocardioides scoriae]